MLLARYLLAVCGLTLTGVMMAGNIMFAYDMVSGASIIAKTMFLSISVTADVVPIAMVIVMPRQHAARKMWHVLAAMAIWLITSGFAIYSCGEWFKTTFEPAEIAQQRTQESIKGIQDKIRLETDQLAAANQAALNATTQMKREDAKREATAARARITALEEKKWPASVVPANVLKHGFRGWEIQAAIVVFILAQACWFFAFDEDRTDPQPPQPVSQPPQPDADQDWLSTGCVNHASTTRQPRLNQTGKPDIPLATNDNFGCQPEVNQPSTTPQPLVNHSSTTSTSGQPVDQPVVGTIRALVAEPPSIGERVERMARDRYSERIIADTLGITRHQVRAIKADRVSAKMAAQ